MTPAEPPDQPSHPRTVAPSPPERLPRRRRLSRRAFVVGGAATGLLAACGDPGDGASDSPTQGAPQLVALTSPDHVIAAGLAQRIPFAVVDVGGLDLADDAEVGVDILFGGERISSTTVLGRLVDHDHGAANDDPDHEHADLLRYFALRAELPEPGIYDLEVDFGDGRIGRLPIQAFDRAEVPVPLPGDPLPAVATPTFDRPEGISPLCTRVPEPCAFHEHDVADVVGGGRPLALLVATPALCATAYCGPVLQTMIDVAPEFGGTTFVHLEVYANASEVDGNYADPSIELARPVQGLGLTFEPSLFLVDGSGIVVDRIDNIFDTDELRSGLTDLERR